MNTSANWLSLCVIGAVVGAKDPRNQAPSVLPCWCHIKDFFLFTTTLYFITQCIEYHILEYNIAGHDINRTCLWVTTPTPSRCLHRVPQRWFPMES